MRYAEEKIKDAILHPNPTVRDRAASSFGKSSRPDPSIMPLVIWAVRAFGRATERRVTRR